MENQEVILTPYDNEVTLLYKWSEVFQVPVRLIVVRQRSLDKASENASEREIHEGTDTLIFEPLQNIVARLAFDEEMFPGDVFSRITALNPGIDIEDIMMAYFTLLLSNEERDTSKDLETINSVYSDMNEDVIEKYDSMTKLLEDARAWNEKITGELSAEEKRRNIIKDVQFTLQSIVASTPFSPVTINSSIFSYTPKLLGRGVTPEDGLDIFNSAKTSRFVPFLRYNDNYGKPFFKVYTGDASLTKEAPNYDVTIIPPTKAFAKNTIYMNLLVNDSADYFALPREAFSVVVYHLDTNYLTIESDKRSDAGLLRFLKDALPSLDFEAGKEVKVKGDFKIWGVEFEETSFLDMVLLESLMNVYLYVEENTTPFAMKRRLDVHYRSIYSDILESSSLTEEAYISNSASVSVTLTPKVAEKEEVVEIFDFSRNTSTKGVLPAASSYLQVIITQAESYNTVKQFVAIFRLLFQHYLDTRTAKIVRYRRLIPELVNLPALLGGRKKQTEERSPRVGSSQSLSKRSSSVLLDLQEKAPELFVRDYSRECQTAKLQPILLKPNELDAWLSANVGPDGKKRQAMPFSKSHLTLSTPDYYFVCPHDNDPYPGLKENCRLENKEEYPYLPCCFKTDQMAPSSNSKYQNFVNGHRPNCKEGAKAEHLIVTGAILGPGRAAKLPLAIENVLKRYDENAEHMVRIGVVNSPNSLLHCVCTAVDDPNYRAAVDIAAKELYVTRLRNHMLAMIKPALLRQEFYDSTEEEIRNELADARVFFDPFLFYRAVEETFNVNIYVFKLPVSNISSEANPGSLEVPRSKGFHTRPVRKYRATVVLVKVEDDSNENPQCEVIAEQGEGGTLTVLFGESMAKICHTVLTDMAKTITWSVNPDFTSLVAHSNIYYFVDHLEMFKLPAVKQYVDNDGKMRGLVLDVLGESMTVVTIPSQPENLPTLLASELSLASTETVSKVLGAPSAVTKDAAGYVTGLWFQLLDVKFGEYVPVVSVAPTREFAELELGPPNPLTANMGVVSLTSRLTKLRHTLNIIVQLVRWLYEVARLQNDKTTPAAFATNYLSMNVGEVVDSSSYYDLSRLQRRLPRVSTVEEGISSLSTVLPTLFGNGRIIMYSKTFSDRIYKMLQDYNALHFGDLPKPPEFIANFFESEDDFLKVPASKLFVNEKDLAAWLSSVNLSKSSKYMMIRRKIEVGLSFTMDPYLYLDEDGKIFIVQNVIGGNLRKVLTLTTHWDSYKINIGSDPPSSGSESLYMIYGISSTSTLVPVKDLTAKQEIFQRVLYYGTQAEFDAGKDGKYAALLELL